ncbi:MAG TPA: FliH/SctL family protein [Terriglobales bacterium]|nr:FliH/SctL family protein [Terriglobales bacterium]
MSSDRESDGTGTMQAETFRYIPASGNGTESSENPPGPWQAPGAAENGIAAKKEKESYERGVREGEARAKSAFETQLKAAKSSVTAAIAQFKTERENYFNRVEPEAVQLALAIARKILHREAQIDPLLLTGMVHVALEKLEAGTRVRLRAHPSDIPFWTDFFAQQASTAEKPELIGDPGLQRGECALETEFGSTQVSLDTQLKEIEQGFLDLLEQRPQVR